MNTNGRFRPCETKWYFVRNEDKKIVIHNSSNRPLKKDGKEIGDVLNISTSKSNKKDERLKVREQTLYKKKNNNNNNNNNNPQPKLRL